MREYSKREKRHLRDLIAIAERREISKHLEELAEKFDQWRQNALSPWELVDAIHEFHHGPNREMYNRSQSTDMLPFWVGYALRNQFLSAEDIPSDLRQELINLASVAAN